MNTSRLSDYLGHMQQAATDAMSFVDGLDRDDFLADKRTQQAVVMSLLIIGETATQILNRHPTLTQSHPDIPWRNMRGMRNRIAHGYFEIDFDVVWETVKTALPALVAQLSTVRQKECP